MTITMNLRRHWWSVSTLVMALAYAAVSLSLPRSPAVVAFGDISILLLIATATAFLTWNAISTQGQVRLFWALIALGCLLWTVNQVLWTFYEVILRRDLPDPFIGDVILFLHIVPVMPAVALFSLRT